MAVYVPIDEGGRPVATGSRHCDLWCFGTPDEVTYLGDIRVPRYGEVPIFETPQGRVAYVNNGDRLRHQVPAACDCLREEGPLPSDKRWDGWRQQLAKLPHTGVYDIYDSTGRRCQIGSGSPLAARVESRFKATMEGRVVADAMCWVHDLLMAGQVPEIRSLPVKPGETPLDAEKRLRRSRRMQRWQVSSKV